MIVVGTLTSLHVVGVNIQPLLAFGGVSGIAIGLGAQQVMSSLFQPHQLGVTDLGAVRSGSLRPKPVGFQASFNDLCFNSGGNSKNLRAP